MSTATLVLPPHVRALRDRLLDVVAADPDTTLDDAALALAAALAVVRAAAEDMAAAEAAAPAGEAA